MGTFSIFATSPYRHLIEILLEQLSQILLQNSAQPLKSQKFFPIFFLLFIFLSLSNLIGLFPFSYTITSHIIITFALSFILFIGINIRALKDLKLQYFSLFLPSGAPTMIIPLLFAIETISYMARVFSLAIRLFANMMAGHTLLKILSSIAYLLLVNGTLLTFLSGLFPLTLITLILCLEIAIALLQAYVFTLLTIIYLNDIFNLH